jgi:hypothetical protein
MPDLRDYRLLCNYTCAIPHLSSDTVFFLFVWNEELEHSPYNARGSVHFCFPDCARNANERIIFLLRCAPPQNAHMCLRSGNCLRVRAMAAVSAVCAVATSRQGQRPNRDERSIPQSAQTLTPGITWVGHVGGGSGVRTRFRSDSRSGCGLRSEERDSASAPCHNTSGRSYTNPH